MILTLLRPTKDGRLVNVNEDSVVLVIGTVSSVPGISPGAATGDTEDEDDSRFCRIVAPTTMPTIVPTTARKTRAMTALPLVVRQKGFVFE